MSLVDSLSVNVALWISIVKCTLDVTISSHIYAQRLEKNIRGWTMQNLLKTAYFSKFT